MKKLALIAPAALFALAACGSSTDASEDAVADTVEVPADTAMEDTPPPVAADLPPEDNAAAEAEMEENITNAEEAAEAAQATVDDVLAEVEAAETE